jgi:hypothetical protein
MATAQQQVYQNVVALSTGLREANILLYTVYPLSPADEPIQTYSYQDYLKGVAKVSDAIFGDLGLEVFTLHTGGLALKASTDIPGMISKCLADTGTWYELSIDESPHEKPTEYHHIQVKVDKPGAVVRTIDGYYAQP